MYYLLHLIHITFFSASFSCYEFYVEIINTFLILFSTQLRHPLKFEDSHYFLDIFMSKFSHRTDAVVARLLENVIEQSQPPPQSSSVMYTAYNYFFSSKGASSPNTVPVADLSLLLLLLLGFQSRQRYQVWVSGFRQAVSSLGDHRGKCTDL